MSDYQDVIDLTVRLCDVGAKNIYCEGDGISFVIEDKVFRITQTYCEGYRVTETTGNYNRTTADSVRIEALINDLEDHNEL